MVICGTKLSLLSKIDKDLKQYAVDAVNVT
jgi:hypothetical protein